jgi:murein DD-endopeptidase MepM/ murein hydrolase activator NlpD
MGGIAHRTRSDARARRVLAILAVAGVLVLPAAAAPADTPLIDPGPFGPEHITLNDGRIVEIPPATVALYRMLTQTGRLHGRHTARPTDADVHAGIELRRRHEPYWTSRFGDRGHTPEAAYVSPIEHGWLSIRSGYKPGHRAEDIFAPPGQRVFAPASMLILHAGYLSKTAGEAVVGFVPATPGQSRARYFTFVHMDVSPVRARVGDIVEAGTLLGYVARGDEAVVGNGLGRLPHVHFAIAEERPDGQLEGIRVWDLLRRAMSHRANISRERRPVS